jgi:hypothetical protein
MYYEIAGGIVFSAAIAGVQFHLYRQNSKLFAFLAQQIAAHTKSFTTSLDNHAASLGQKIETSKVAGRIERIICPQCKRLVYKFNASGICLDCAGKE